MDSLIAAAAHALAAGDPLGALKLVALRGDAPALALRGIAMAQLGDLVRAKALLRKASRAFSPKEALARARCIVAEAEIALVSRDLSWPAQALDTARAALERHGDRTNAAYAQHLEVRRLPRAERAGRTPHQHPRTLEIAELGHGDAAKCQRRRVIAQRHAVQRAEGIARRERSGCRRDQ